jgi:hypothetical protein
MALTDHILAFWNFNGRLANTPYGNYSFSSEDGNDYYTTGVEGQAWNLQDDYTTRRLTCKPVTNLAADETDLGVSVWMRRDDAVNCRPFSLTKPSTPTTVMVLIRILSDGQILVQQLSPGEGVLRTIATTNTGVFTFDNSWQHLVINYPHVSDEDVEIWVDGVDVTLTTEAPTLYTIDSDWEISCPYQSNFGTDIDLMGLFSKKLTSDEVAELYNSGDGWEPGFDEASTDPVMFFTFDDTLTDNVNGVTVTPKDATTHYVTGKLGKGYNFSADANDNGLSLYPAPITPAGTDFTISFWVKFDELLAFSFNHICSWENADDSSYRFNIQYAYNPGSLNWMVAVVNATSLYWNVDGMVTPDGNTWHHVVMVFEEGQKPLCYIDNVVAPEQTVSALSPKMLGGETTLEFGSFANLTPATNYLKGTLDAFGYWNRILTSGERAAIYNSGDGWQYTPPSSGVDRGRWPIGVCQPSGQ